MADTPKLPGVPGNSAGDPSKPPKPQRPTPKNEEVPTKPSAEKPPQGEVESPQPDAGGQPVAEKGDGKKQSEKDSPASSPEAGKDERTKKDVAKDVAKAAVTSDGTGKTKAKTGATAAARGNIDEAAQQGVEAAAEATASAVASPVAGKAVSAAFETKIGRKVSKGAGKGVKWTVVVAVGAPILALGLVLALMLSSVVGGMSSIQAINGSCLDDYTNLGVNIGDQGDLSNEAYIWQSLRAEGLSEESTAGIMGNIENESGFDPKIENGIGAFGIAQWLDGRRTRLENYATKNDMDYKTLEAQVAYLIYESKRWERSAWNKVKQAATVSEAAEIWLYDWERAHTRGSSGGALEAAERVSAAKKWYNTFKGTDAGNPPPPSGEGDPDPGDLGINELEISDKSAPPVKGNISVGAGLYYSDGSAHGAWDISVGRGTNVYAVKEGIVSAVADGYPNTGGGSGAPDNHVLLQTKYKGKPVTVEYHHLSPGVKDFVKVGDRVAAGQQLGKSGNSGHSKGDHLHLNVVWGATGQSFSQWGKTSNPPIVFPPNLVWKGGEQAQYSDGQAEGVSVEGPVFIVGDSLTVGSKAEIDNNYEEIQVKQTTDAQIGRTLAEGYTVLKNDPAAKKANTWFVALGTNDGGLSKKRAESQVKRILQLAENRDVYWVNVHLPDNKYTSMFNKVLSAQEEKNSRLTVIDFNGELSNNPQYLAEDGIHLTPEGYNWRADLYVPKANKADEYSDISADCREELGVGSGYFTGALDGEYGNPWSVADAYRTAVKFALDGNGSQYAGLCLRWVTLLYGWGGGYDYAYQQWTNADPSIRHPGNGKDAPPGALLVWPNESNGGVGGQAGHIAIAVGDGKHMLTTTDGAVKVLKISSYQGVYGWMEPVFPASGGTNPDFSKVTEQEMPNPVQELIDAKLVPDFQPATSFGTSEDETDKDKDKDKGKDNGENP